METLEIYADFLHNSLCIKNKNSIGGMSSFAFGKISSCNQWWTTFSTQFSQRIGSNSGTPAHLYTYLTSCQFTEHLVNLKTDDLNTSVKELNTENKELKSLIYGMLDEINDLKEHQRCLSERIVCLENKPPLILY